MIWPLYTQTEAPVPTAEETGWAPGLFQTNVYSRKYLNPNAVWTSDCPVSDTIFKTLANITKPLELELKKNWLKHTFHLDWHITPVAGVYMYHRALSDKFLALASVELWHLACPLPSKLHAEGLICEPEYDFKHKKNTVFKSFLRHYLCLTPSSSCFTIISCLYTINGIN